MMHASMFSFYFILLIYIADVTSLLGRAYVKVNKRNLQLNLHHISLLSVDDCGLLSDNENECINDFPRVPTKFITKTYLNELVKYLSDEKNPPINDVIRILMTAIKYFSTLPSLTRLTIPDNGAVNICGDTHGQFYDVCNIFNLNGYPSSDNVYLFNGDFVDRGHYSFENMLLLLVLKLHNPDSIHFNRGNHESESMNNRYGFRNEIIKKYDTKIFQLFIKIFNLLPVATAIEDKIFVTHGGLGANPNLVLEDINKIDRNHDIVGSTVSDDMLSLLWSGTLLTPA